MTPEGPVQIPLSPFNKKGLQSSPFLLNEKTRSETRAPRKAVPFLLKEDAASTGDLLDMIKWARERKTTLNEEIAKAFIIEDDENVSAQEKAARLGIYFNGSQSTSKKDNSITFTRRVGYIQNGPSIIGQLILINKKAVIK